MTFDYYSLKYPPESHKNILVCSGPGNNGGDGLVCARHLKLFGYFPKVYYPKPTNKPIFNRLVAQCTLMGINFLDSTPDYLEPFSLIVDALFGFSFKPPIRDDFLPIMKYLAETKNAVVSIDIPSGWDVENGPLEEPVVKPDMLISLTAPKLCAKYFKGKYHFLGGRFLPQTLIDEYQLKLPSYPGSEQVIQIERFQ